MSLIAAPRTAQFPLVAYFGFRFDDTVIDVDGNLVDFGASNLGPTTIVVAPLPPGAMVIGGSISSTQEFDTAALPVTIGDALVPDRYFAADKKSEGFSPLVPTGFIGNGENIEFTFIFDGVATQGAAVIVVEYLVANRANEVQIA